MKYSASDFAGLVASHTGIVVRKVLQTIELLEQGATIPFIARYRKEATGSLDEVEIADIAKELKKLKEMEGRKETILTTIQEQGKLTDDLRRRIEQCWNSTELEDIYLPYKPKRKTRASVAREKGLEPLALFILEQTARGALSAEAEKYVREAVNDIEEALQGARDIIAELVSEDAEVRQRVRIAFERGAAISSRVARGKEKEGEKYHDYFEFSEPLSRCPSHRLLAMRRGEAEGFLRLTIAPDEEQVINGMTGMYVKNNSDSGKQVQEAVADSYKRLLQPSIETEFRNSSKERADTEAIKVFVENLRQLLLAPPLGERRIMGIDPGYRTGCKVVCLNEQADLLHHTAIYPHPPQNQSVLAAITLQDIVADYHIDAIAVGNGTAGRETLTFCQGLDFGNRKVALFQVSEAGASIYSASEIAREEFADYDLTVRGAVSIGRRLMDPLAELVKIDPKSIGVGQYQHDVNQAHLKESLDRTVESAVNSVGINLNTASKHLLTYVSGLGPSLAQAIVAYRTAHGSFTSRGQLKKVPRLGEKAFEQCAGFLRIRDAQHVLDNTAVHPESYHIVERMAADLSVSVPELLQDPALRRRIDISQYVSEKIGLPTLTDIMKELEKPGLDPRGEARAFEFANVHSIQDLQPGMILPGIVTNLTNFGAFVDVGVKQDGMVHISQIVHKFIKSPADVLSLGQEVKVKVLEVDAARKRINLSIKEA